MQLLCEVVKHESPQTGITLETEYTLESQRGVWNKNTLKWWVKGQEKEEIFNESRKVFLRKVFNLAFTELDIEIPIVFIMAESEADADIVIEFMKRENSPYHRDNPRVLAYAGYEDGALKGIMVIFTDWDWDITGNLNLVSVIIHELYHIMGRPHSSRDWTHKDIMYPSIRSSVTESSEWDVLGLTTAYGIRVYHYDTGHDRLEKANRHGKKRLALQGLTPFAKE